MHPLKLGKGYFTIFLVVQGLQEELDIVQWGVKERKTGSLLRHYRDLKSQY